MIVFPDSVNFATNPHIFFFIASTAVIFNPSLSNAHQFGFSAS
jgi:hypothetical protein